MDPGLRKPSHHVRFVTAAALFDGHDASINIIRRLLQAAGAEVIHLGHNRSAEEIVNAAVQEDAQGIAVSSYQGGHVEFFKYLKDLLVAKKASHVKIFGGGGGTIVPREIEDLERYGITRIFSPEDGRVMGLEGIVDEMIGATDFAPPPVQHVNGLKAGQATAALLGRLVTAAESNGAGGVLTEVARRGEAVRVPVIGVTGTGGAGKSSFIDELVRRFLMDFRDKTIGVLSIDPTKRKTGGALLGDRIRMNAIDDPRVFMRSLATRAAGRSLSEATSAAILVLKAAGHDLVLVETSGIGQAESSIVDVSDVSVYVMTPDFGAQSQLEKIDMIDFADVVVVNKFDRPGGADALRDVRKQVRRSRGVQTAPDAELPVFGTISSQFNDPGVTAAYRELIAAVDRKCGLDWRSSLELPASRETTARSRMIPANRQQYLAEVSASCRTYRARAERAVEAAERLEHAEGTLARLRERKAPAAAVEEVARLVEESRRDLDPAAAALLASWPATRAAYAAEELAFQVRDQKVRLPLATRTLSGTRIPKVALPALRSRADVLRFLLLENLPGRFPFTEGVFELRRVGEDPTRQFAGEGPPERTNRRFHYLSRNSQAKRLSTAFDSVTLYGQDPARRPDIYGKIGESGVSICTLDDMKKLFHGFDLCDPNTSVSMTINGPAPAILAMFFNAAIEQQLAKSAAGRGGAPTEADRGGIVARTLEAVRGTVQADILKEDQAQNTCIFSTEFALRMMGDIQQYFIDHRVRNYYSVSISGYHIAEAGANPITQLAFTLANGFTYLEYYMSRGMSVDEVAPNLSFFFSNGLDAEYSVLGRVARRIWAVAIRDVYGGNERSQKLKYHIQTSGRSLHAQEIHFNDIRTTLQALLALQDNCNSLHTNAFDEAVTTPTEESVRRALAIQQIINREYGIMRNENGLQGSYVIEELTDLVEKAVLDEFERVSERGGVLGAMETQYQRSRIQEESLLYERRKHSGELPVVGVNTFVDEHQDHAASINRMELTRSTPEEKESRLGDLEAFQKAHGAESGPALRRLQQVALDPKGNVFDELMRTVRVASLGQITHALFEVGGEYRRNL